MDIFIDDSDTDDEYTTRYIDGYSPEIQLNQALNFVGIRAVTIQDWAAIVYQKLLMVIKKTCSYIHHPIDIMKFLVLSKRHMCIEIEHFVLEIMVLKLFQKLWRDFHYIKMARYKAIKNLQYRQIYGKILFQNNQQLVHLLELHPMYSPSSIFLFL